MPASLPSAPWLDAKPSDPAHQYTQGYGLGMQASADQARINQQQAALQQQAQQTQMELEQRKKEKENQFLMDQQQMNIAQQYHQQQIALGQQKLDEAKQLNDVKIQKASQQAAAQMEADQRIKGGEDPATVWSDIGPRAGLGGAGFSSLVKQAQPKPQAEWQEPQGGAPGYFKQPGGQAYVPPGMNKESTDQKQENMVLKEQADALRGAISGLWKDYGASSKEKVKANLRTQIDELTGKLQELAPGGKATAPSGKQKLDKTTAMWFMNEAKGDKSKARQLAKDAGYEF